jgi:DNA (cytosine-5)-methyltransferase 1
MRPLIVFEFFAGGGMARAGLGDSWRCVLANDIDAKKGASYAANWGAEGLRVCDVADLTTDDMPERPDLARASPPCQDLSLAGERAGLGGSRSNAFWPWWRLMQALRAEGRAPKLIVIENVAGLLSSHCGRDFEAIRSTLIDGGYRVGALMIDAALFVPQSRERLFIIAVANDIHIPAELLTDKPRPGQRTPFHPPPLVALMDPLPDPRFDLPLMSTGAAAPLWWRLPAPPPRNTTFADIIEDEPTGVRWHTQRETERLMAMMTRGNLAKVEAAKRSGKGMVGGLYRRTRPTEDGRKVSRWEARFDGIAGCLRVPTGGSSRQSVMIIEGNQVRSRILSPREAARVMGLNDDYQLPSKYNDACGLMGDGVCVPVVRHLARHLLEPILASRYATDIEGFDLWFELREDEGREGSHEKAAAE